MKTINLLPRKPFAERAFVPLLAASVALSVLIALLIGFFVIRYEANIDNKSGKTAEIQEQIKQLQALRIVDSATADFNALSEEVNKLKASRRYWIPVFEALASSLPKTSRITSMGFDDHEKLTVAMETDSLDHIADYTTLLQRVPLVDKLSVAKIEKISKSASVGDQTLYAYSVTIEISLTKLSQPK
ncbi:hypothetical protein FE783_00145 [Paenibacillus mesophilus]|uniref:PilN domain-containing protein n=1 Tax=Paenibacillus mesophilus TaxID=2582849 RepID=UPI00110D9463|nr:hypothetical protein [Paenibacillus mesophilus]TMV52644.1 hypothetical protein FE783_00145 [Paenibacillus mesophilus]